VDPVPDQLLLRKSESTGNRSVARSSDHWTTEVVVRPACTLTNPVSVQSWVSY
jgi:hypothetical protein